jgi:glycogen operon protein
VEKNEELLRFVRALIAFRRQQPTVRRANFLRGAAHRPGDLPDVSWFSHDGGPVDWDRDEHCLMCMFAAPKGEAGQPKPKNVLLMIHAGIEPCDFVLPPLVQLADWRLFVNTAAASPADVYPQGDGPACPTHGVVRLEPRTLACYVA